MSSSNLNAAIFRIGSTGITDNSWYGFEDDTKATIVKGGPADSISGSITSLSTYEEYFDHFRDSSVDIDQPSIPFHFRQETSRTEDGNSDNWKLKAAVVNTTLNSEYIIHFTESPYTIQIISSQYSNVPYQLILEGASSYGRLTYPVRRSLNSDDRRNLVTTIDGV